MAPAQPRHSSLRPRIGVTSSAKLFFPLISDTISSSWACHLSLRVYNINLELDQTKPAFN